MQIVFKNHQCTNKVELQQRNHLEKFTSEFLRYETECLGLYVFRFPGCPFDCMYIALCAMFEELGSEFVLQSF